MTTIRSNVTVDGMPPDFSIDRGNCSLCGQPLNAMAIGVIGGGSFHPECHARTYTIRERFAVWLHNIRWRLRGRRLEDGLASPGAVYLRS